MENKTTSRLNGMIIGGVIINAIISIFSLNNPDFREMEGLVLIIMFIPLIISIIGILMVLNNKLIWGYRLIIAGTVFFAPIGLIALFGVIKAKKADDYLDFDKRRMELEQEKKQ